MASTPTCLVCQKEMEKGFMTDHAGGSVLVPRWCAGDYGSTPKGVPGGASRQSYYDRGVDVVAYRCPQCQALRLYAPAPR